jgi:hypothetical protein
MMQIEFNDLDLSSESRLKCFFRDKVIKSTNLRKSLNYIFAILIAN